MKTSIIAIVIVIGVVITGCSTGNVPMTAKDKIKFSCIDGVEYILFKESAGNAGWGFMSAHYHPDGTLFTCGDKN